MTGVLSYSYLPFGSQRAYAAVPMIFGGWRVYRITLRVLCRACCNGPPAVGLRVLTSKREGDNRTSCNSRGPPPQRTRRA